MFIYLHLTDIPLAMFKPLHMYVNVVIEGIICVVLCDKDAFYVEWSILLYMC